MISDHSNANLVVKNNCLQVKDAKSNHLAVILFIKKKLHGKFGFFFLWRFLNSLFSSSFFFGRGHRIWPPVRMAPFGLARYQLIFIACSQRIRVFLMLGK